MVTHNGSKQACSAPVTRNTVQRALVLDAVRSMHNHPTSADVYETVRQAHPSISRATVYRNLNVLADQGEVLRVHVAGGADRYDLRSDPHYHLKCTVCGRIFDADLPYMEQLVDEVRHTEGFFITGHDIVFTGICGQCCTQAEEGNDFQTDK